MTLAALFRSIENPNTPLTPSSIAASSFGSLWGGKATVPAVSEDRAFGISAYYRGIAILSGTMAKLPLKVQKKGTKQRVRQTTVLDQPNPRQVPFAFWQTMFSTAIPWGNTYAWKVRNGASVITELWPLHPAFVRVEEAPKTQSNPEGKVFLVRDKDGTEKRYTTWHILHIPYMAVDGLVGKSPLSLARQVLGTAVAAEEHAGKFFVNGTQLGGILTTDQELDPTSSKALKDRWRELHSGSLNAYEIAVLDSGTTFQALTIPAKDAQLLETRGFSVTEIARLLGLPSHLLNDMEKSSSWGTGIESMTTGLTVFNLDQWLTLTEQIITAEVLPGGRTSGSWEAEWTREALMRGDSAARAQFYREMVQIGAMCRNEVRVRENLEPVPSGDEFMLPANFTLIDANGDLRPLAQSPTTDATDGTSARAVAELIQKIYLGVGVMLSPDEAREIANQAGANLPAGFSPAA